MSRAMEVLDQLVQQQPESVKPIFSHLSGMLKSTQLAFDSHVGDNDSIFGQIQVQIASQADRVVALEHWTDRAGAQGTELRDRVDKLETRANAVMTDGNTAVEAIKGIEAKIAVIHDVVNALGQNIMGFASTLESVKLHVDNIDILTVDVQSMDTLANKVKQIEQTLAGMVSGGPNAGYVGGALKNET